MTRPEFNRWLFDCSARLCWAMLGWLACLVTIAVALRTIAWGY